MDRCDAFLMFDIVRHLSHKSIICQNNRPSPRNETIGQDDVKSTLETDSDKGKQMDIFSL
jgi:hypothetical protein